MTRGLQMVIGSAEDTLHTSSNHAWRGRVAIIKVFVPLDCHELGGFGGEGFAISRLMIVNHFVNRQVQYSSLFVCSCNTLLGTRVIEKLALPSG